MPGQDEVDAVLRGDAPPTPEVEAMIANLDEALAARPTPEPIVVWAASDAEHLGDLGGIEGRRIIEPTFLQAHLETADAEYGDAAVVLRLRVPAGVPAVLLSQGGGRSASSVLLLARGLVWTVTQVVRFPDRTFVLGAVEP